MDQRKQPQTAGESASLGGQSPLKPGQAPKDSVGQDREPVISPERKRESERYREEQQGGGGDSTEGSREFLIGGGPTGQPGKGSSRKTGQGSPDDQGSPAGAADIESGQPATRQDARLDDASTSGR